MSDDKRADSLISGIPALDSEWQETLGILCLELKASKTSGEARARFFSGYRNACKRVALRLLSSWKWQGDIQRDAEDIASESTKILIGQEARGAGIFGSKAMSTAQLRGYLTRTIWRSCVQIAVRMQPKALLISLDQLLEEGWDFGVLRLRSEQELRAELTEIFAALEVNRSKYRKIPEALSLLDCLLWAEFGDGGFDAIKKRTLQRYVNQIRKFLKSEFDDPEDSL